MNFCRYFLVLALFTIHGAANANEVAKVVDWRNLVPTAAPLKNPLDHLKMDVQVEVEVLARIRRMHQLGQITDVDYRFEEALEITHKLKSAGHDVDGLVAKYEELRQQIEQRNNAVVEELDGKFIRMPGYTLPLEFTDTAVSEFLLVPYVGACIHVPAPPANQMVFVQLKQSYKPKDLYEPVWITGRLKVQNTSKSLSFVDGRAPVEAGYTLEGIRVEPYKE